MPVPTELQAKVNEIIASWDDEAKLWDGWQEVPELFCMSRRRLPRLIKLDAPNIVIQNEIEITRRNIVRMREVRRSALH